MVFCYLGADACGCPVQLVEVVCCKMTQLQRDIYCHFLESKAAARLLGDSSKKGGGTQILGAINTLKKLCNHPKLIYDVVHGRDKSELGGFDGCAKFFTPGAPAHCCASDHYEKQRRPTSPPFNHA